MEVGEHLERTHLGKRSYTSPIDEADSGESLTPLFCV